MSGRLSRWRRSEARPIASALFARIEARIAIATLLCRMTGRRQKVSPDFLRGRPSMVLRGLDSLPVLF
jgi:cytochrome P450